MGFISSSALFILTTGVLGAPTLDSGPVVDTDYGPVEGLSLRGVTVFHGIPFAKPPVGSLRWTYPQQPEKWTTPIKSPAKAAAACPQMDVIRGFHTGKEDCLHISVHVPDGCTATTPCPVMQWIYGGAWIVGANEGTSGQYDGANLAKQHKVVVVAGNYRLDSLGWLALRELQEEDPNGSFGNYGLHDQRAGLRWTQRNVARFGGDPAQVTIFGESAGAWSVCQHLVSPASNHLFSRAIIESGDCDGPWMIFDGSDAQNWGAALSTKMGCTGDDKLKCLRGKPLKDVMLPYVDWLCPFPKLEHQDPYCNQSAHDANATGGKTWPTARPPFAPVAGYAAVVDGTPEGLPDVPIRLIQAGKVNVSPNGAKIAVILGTNTDEFAAFLITVPTVIHGTKLPATVTDWPLVAQHLIEYHRFWNETTAKQIVDAYPASEYKHEAERIVAAGTDFCFRCGTRIAARALAAAGIDTYLYQFDFKGPKYKKPDGLLCQITSDLGGCGVRHGAEIEYVFGNENQPLLHPKQKVMAQTMGTYWTNFAKFGTPNSVEVPVQWPLYVQKEDKHLVLAEQVKISWNLGKPKCDFWDTLPREGPYSKPAANALN